jgi:hypothetical protein
VNVLTVVTEVGVPMEHILGVNIDSSLQISHFSEWKSCAGLSTFRFKNLRKFESKFKDEL